MAKSELVLNAPLMNAAGCLGFAPDTRGPVDLSMLGAFITNPISIGTRSPAHGVRYLSFPGGFMLHTGYPNPGLNAAIRRYGVRWKRSPLPVLIHLLAQNSGEMTAMVRKLERQEGVAGLEIGLPAEADAEMVRSFARAAAGELPVVVRLPMDHADRLAEGIDRTAVAAVSLAPPRGALPSPEGELVQGRLYGPALFPLALSAVQALKRRGIPVIGAGGIYTMAQAEAMLQAGAIAVQLDAVLWRGGWQE